MSEEKKLKWDDVPEDIAKEKVTPEDQAAAESGGRVPPGKYLCECMGSTPAQVNLDAYSTFKAKLKFEVIQTLEVDGKPGNRTDLIGRSIYDDVLLAHPKEKDAIKNRRIFIAKRLGLINEMSTEIPRAKWAAEIIGKQAILTVELNRYEKDGVMKENTKVAMFGYDYAANAAKSAAISKPVNTDDI